MKKFLLMLTVVIVSTICISNEVEANENNIDTVVREIINDENISDETKEWIRWFNSLTAQEQQFISYRPYELKDYQYEKEYGFNVIAYSNFDNDISLFGGVVDNQGNKILPVSGYEKTYNANFWRDNYNMIRSNCYTYALDYVADLNINSKEPGYASGRIHESLTKNSIINAVKRDVNYIPTLKGFREAGEYEKPRYREYKVALVISPGKDYHWYRQDHDGYWSHKREYTWSTRTDASGRSIINPRYANRVYDTTNYSEFCGFYFVKY